MTQLQRTALSSANLLVSQMGAALVTTPTILSALDTHMHFLECGQLSILRELQIPAHLFLLLQPWTLQQGVPHTSPR